MQEARTAMYITTSTVKLFSRLNRRTWFAIQPLQAIRDCIRIALRNESVIITAAEVKAGRTTYTHPENQRLIRPCRTYIHEQKHTPN
jgi:hypothetical protein